MSGYRTTAYVVSPYSRRRGVISTQYNQTSLLRTMELILGLPTMHIMDASATPMTDCFGDTADLTPYTVIPSNIPLDQVNPDPKKVVDKLLGRLGRQSSQLPLHAPDLCDEDTLNRILWHAMKGSSSPYPQWAAGVSDDD